MANNTSDIKELVNSSTVSVLKQILKHFQEQDPSLVTPRLKKEYQDQILKCLDNNNYKKIRGYSLQGNTLTIQSDEDLEKADFVPEEDSEEPKSEDSVTKRKFKFMRTYSRRDQAAGKQDPGPAKKEADGANMTDLKTKNKTLKPSEAKSTKRRISTTILDHAPWEERMKLIAKPDAKPTEILANIKTEILMNERRKDFCEISSIVFSKAELTQARVLFDLDTENFTFQKVRKELPEFPWLLFDVEKIPANSYMISDLKRMKSDSIKAVEIDDDGIYEIEDDQWKFTHVINSHWSTYFGLFLSLFNSSRIGMMRTNAARDEIEFLAYSICSIFGHTTGRYYNLNPFPGFPVVRESMPVIVQPDVAASLWSVDESSGCVYSSLDKDMAITPFLAKLMEKCPWVPNVCTEICPHVIVECKHTNSTHESDLIKLLIELAMVRDFQARLFKKPPSFTIGVYVANWSWKIFALGDTTIDGYKYRAHHLATFELDDDFISWLRLGVVMVHLAAYQTSCLLNCQPIDDKKLDDLCKRAREENERLKEKMKERRDVVQRTNISSSQTNTRKRKFSEVSRESKSNQRSKRQKKHESLAVKNTTTNAKETAKRNNTSSSQPQRPIWNESFDCLERQEIYSGPYVKAYSCVDKKSGEEFASKEFKHRSEGLYEAALLSLVQGDGVVKLHHVSQQNDKVQLWLEKLSPLPDCITHEDLRRFIRGLLEAIYYVHSQCIIHGDIKHSNVMIDPITNQVKLIDFGFSVRLMPGETIRYFHGGTMAYASPERLEREIESNKIDIFSAGLVCAEKMYRTRIGSCACRINMIRRVFDDDLSELATTQGVDLLRRMLCSSPDKRPSALECLQHPYLNDSTDLSD